MNLRPVSKHATLVLVRRRPVSNLLQGFPKACFAAFGLPLFDAYRILYGAPIGEKRHDL
jgi:hypothetical protein